MMIEILPNWHPIFVHFTIALLFIATLLFVLGALASANATWKQGCIAAARWNLGIGVLITVGTVLAGWYAYNTVNHDEASHIAMTNHRNWALFTASLFVLLAIWSFISRKSHPGWLFIISIIAASFLLAVTGYKGGELVYRHGLGVMSLPQVEGTGHSHHHHEQAEPASVLHEEHDHPHEHNDESEHNHEHSH